MEPSLEEFGVNSAWGTPGVLGEGNRARRTELPPKYTLRAKEKIDLDLLLPATFFFLSHPFTA